MAEAGIAGACYGTNVNPGSSVTYYGNFGNSAGAALGAETTEANVELIHRGSNATLKNLRVVVATNARAGTSSVTTRKNNADTAQVATITASTTGTYTDLSNTVSVTAGDKVAYKLVIGGTSGNFAAPSITLNHESAGQAFNYWSGIGSASTTNASATRYWNVTGSLATPVTSEVAVQSYAPAAGALSNLRAYVTAARATNTTLKSRIGGADGAMSVTLTASTTGAFEDTTNSDTISAGNLINIATATGTGSDTLTISCLSVRYVPSTAGVTASGSGALSAAQLASGTTRYFSPIGQIAAQTSEGMAQQAAPFAGTVSYLSSVVSANASTATTTVVLRKGGSNTAVTYSIPGGSTGSFADTSNTETVAAGDLLSVQGSGSDGQVSFRTMGLRFAEAAGPITGTLAVTEAGDTLSSASALRIAGTLASTEADDSLSSTASVALAAAAAITEADDTLTSAATLALNAALVVTEAGDTLVAFAGATIVGDLALTEADDTVFAEAILISGVFADADIDEADDTLVALGTSQFWSPVSPNAETWAPVSATPEIWTVQ